MQQIHDALKEYGLSEKEGSVYLALLTIGESTVNQTAEKADLVRTTTYDILKGLREKGMVSSVVKNSVLYFDAVDPNKLIQVLDLKREKIKGIIPELKRLKTNIPKKPTVELYEGKEGMKTVYQDILDEKKTLHAFSNTHYVFNVLPYFVPHFIKKRIESGIKIKLLNEKTKESIELMKKNDRKELRETRFIPQMKELAITQYIYADNVAILSTDERNPLGIIIRHPEFAKEQKLLFDLIWERAEK